MKPKITAIVLSVVMICQLFGAAVCAKSASASPIDNPITQAALETLLSKTVDGGHPYLMGRKSDFDAVRTFALGADALISEQYALIKKTAGAYLKTAVKEIPNPSVSYISIGFNSAWRIVPYCAFVYLMEGDEAYAQRAWQEAEYYADMASWGNYQYIDNTQAATAVALCYDWLYDWLSTAQRTKLESALKSKHLDNVKNDYDTGNTAGMAMHLRGKHNHAVMNSATIFMQALAIADGGDISYSAEIMKNALEIINEPLSEMNPDSGWREGAGYWNYVGPMIARMMLSMKSAFGSCLGYENVEYVVNTSYFPLFASSSQGALVINDMNRIGRDTSFDKYILASLSGDAPMMNYSLANDELSHPFFCLAYTQADNSDVQTPFSAPLDKNFSESGIATMRSSWQSNQELFAAMAVQPANMSHGHQNSGTIGFDALGERWITNTGGDDYSLPGYFTIPDKWNYYVTRAEANSCVVINPSTSGGQKINSDDSIDVFRSGSDGAYAVADLTDTYSGQVSSYKRGISLVDNRRRFVLQDEIVMTSPSQMYSFINIYKADIKIADDKKSAIISKGNKKLYMSIICDNNYELSVMDSVPLATSPNPSGQSSFDDIQKIAIKLNGVSKVNLRVSFTPYLTDKELANMKKDTFVAIKDWNVNEASNTPEVESIYINGTPFDGYCKESRIFSVDTINAPAKVEVGLKDGFEAEVTANKVSGNTEIFVYETSDKSNNYSYLLKSISSQSVYADAVRFLSPTYGNIGVTTYSYDSNIGREEFVLLRYELPTLSDTQTIDSAQLQFAVGVHNGAVTAGNIRFAVYGINAELAQPASMTHASVMSYITDANLMDSPGIVQQNVGYRDTGVYHFFSVDASELAKACVNSQRKYMYLAVSARNCNIKLWGTSIKQGFENWRSLANYKISDNNMMSAASVFKYYPADSDGKMLVTEPLCLAGVQGMTVRAVNNAAEDFKFDFIVASYNDDELTAYAKKQIVVAPNTKKEVSESDISSGTSKAFVWTSKLIPLTRSIEK